MPELLPLHHCHPAVPHLDELSLRRRSLLSLPLPSPAPHYSPPSHLSSLRSSPQSVNLPHTGLIPVTALSHIIHPCNMYAIAGGGVRGGAEHSWGQSRKLVKPSLPGPPPLPPISTYFLFRCLSCAEMTVNPHLSLSSYEEFYCAENILMLRGIKTTTVKYCIACKSLQSNLLLRIKSQSGQYEELKLQLISVIESIF